MKNIGQIKALIGVVIVFILAAIIGLVVFISNVKIINSNQEQVVEEEPAEKTSYEQIEVGNVITSVENKESTFRLYDSNGIFKVELEDGAVTFSVENKEMFAKTFPASKMKKDIEEIATHQYKIKDVFIGVINDEEYVIVITGDGKVGSMNVKEAVNNNIFRIKNELLEFEQKIAFIQKVSITNGDDIMDSTLAVAVDGTIYDLSAFLK